MDSCEDNALQGPTDELSMSVVVPAHQAAPFIERCVKGLLDAGFRTSEILVVDDGSRDGTGDIAHALDVGVLRNETPLKPARARNLGVAQTTSDIIVFVDADVVVHPGARARILEAFQSSEDLTALFGSYDDAPKVQNTAARYRNLLHHHVHQSSAGRVESFWTGFGAVRRQAFLAVDGFDATCDMMEDVELGLRLTEGHIELMPDLLCKHLKDWTLFSMFRSDLFDRAIPWTRLIAAGRTRAGQLNLTRNHQFSAASVAFFGLTFLLAVVNVQFLWLSLAALIVFLDVNRRFFGLLYRLGGLRLMVPSIALHGVHYFAALLGYVWVMYVERPFLIERSPSSVASSERETETT